MSKLHFTYLNLNIMKHFKYRFNWWMCSEHTIDNKLQNLFELRFEYILKNKKPFFSGLISIKMNGIEFFIWWFTETYWEFVGFDQLVESFYSTLLNWINYSNIAYGLQNPAIRMILCCNDEYVTDQSLKQFTLNPK